MHCFEREGWFSLYFVFNEFFDEIFLMQFFLFRHHYVIFLIVWWVLRMHLFLCGTRFMPPILKTGPFTVCLTIGTMGGNYITDSHQQGCVIASASIFTHENTFLLQSSGVTRSPLGTRSCSHLAHKGSDFPVSWPSDSDMLFDIFSRLL